MLYIETKNASGAKVLRWQDHHEALWNLVYLRTQFPSVAVITEMGKVVAKFEFGVAKFIEDDFANWIFENVHCHSAIRQVLNVAPGRCI